MRILVVGNRLLDVAFETVDGEVHLGEADGGAVLLQTAEGEPLGRTLVVLLDGARALHEHPAGAAGGVEHRAPLGIEHAGDERDQRDGGEELAAIVRLLVGEAGEEVLVDAAEDVAGHLLQLVRVEGAEKLAEDVVVEHLVLAFGQHTPKALVVRLDRLHRGDDGPGAVRAVGQGDQVIKLGLFAK